MAKIFLSYSRKDSAVARKLIEAFKEMGHDPWVDWEDIPPAVGWLEQIFRGIEGSDTFFFLVSALMPGPLNHLKNLSSKRLTFRWDVV